MPRLDPEELRQYAQRDWGAPERLARLPRARQTISQKVALADELYQDARAVCPGWASDDARKRDFRNHVRLKSLLTRAANVGAG